MQALIERAELQVIATALMLDVDCVLGKLVRLLAWYGEYGDAVARLVPAVHIDAQMRCAGFALALCDAGVGWLVMNESGVVRPHGFLLAEAKRMMHARQVRSWRAHKRKDKPKITCDETASHVIDPITPSHVIGASRVSTLDKPKAVPEQGLVVDVEAQSKKKAEQHQVLDYGIEPLDRDIALEKNSLPEWLPLDVWKEFIVMRKTQKHPLTEYAKRLCVTKLGELRRQGEDPRVVLEQSIMRGWLGLFDTQRYGFPGRGRQPPPQNFSKLDYEEGATREEDLPDWIKDKST